MSLGAALTEFVTIKKLFSWTIDNFDDIQKQHLEQENEKSKTFVLKSPEMNAIDPFTGKKYTATLKVNYGGENGEYCVFLLDCSPKLDVFYYYVQINDKKMLHKGNRLYYHYNILTKFWRKITKLTISVDYVAKKNETFKVDPFKAFQPKGTFERLKEILENDSSVKITIKAGTSKMEAIKPFLAAHSPVFKAMFDSNMKETAENVVEIPDFEFNIVKKMVEFCENNTIIDCKGSEIEIFKIANKYLMDDLMEFAITQMADHASKDNIKEYIELAKFYHLKEFEKWLMNFACRNNFVIS
uniref:BTB domain-containing protein n=1 Tax=Panagrolaimus sp. ES5 TaxID=591445 RepID=A0AC34F524_9BILA